MNCFKQDRLIREGFPFNIEPSGKELRQVPAQSIGFAYRLTFAREVSLTRSDDNRPVSFLHFVRNGQFNAVGNVRRRKL